MTYTNMANNIYCDFMEKYKYRLLHIQKEYTKEIDENAILLIDFDVYVNGKNVDESVFYCTKQKLPDYALSKMSASGHDNMIALKHAGLCLITKLRE